MKVSLRLIIAALLLIPYSVIAQTNEWATQYVTTDDGANGTGYQTSSVAVLGPNSFVALVTQTPPTTPTGRDVFNPPGNYLVGYVDADSVNGRVAQQEYQPAGQFEVWASGLDQVTFAGAWQIAGGSNNRVYVANNDANHNILVFELTPLGVISTDFRMETGTENIYAIEVSSAGYVYVVDYQGTDAKTNEVKVFAPIGTPGSSWDVVGGHNDAPATTINLPPGIYQGVTVSGDGSQVFVSSVTDRKILKFAGNPVNGYTQDQSFNVTLSANDIAFDIDGLRVAAPRFLGLAFLDDPGLVFAATDTFICAGSSVETCGGYVTGRIFVIDGSSGVVADTIDIAEWNFRLSGAYNSRAGGTAGTLGGYTSVYDVDVSDEPAVYTQTYYGWAVEKWLYDGDLGLLVSVKQRPGLAPRGFALRQNYPNPFNPTTTIEFELPASEHVTLSVYTMLGQKVVTLVNQRMAPGVYQVGFDAGKLPSGTYFYQVEAGKLKTTKKMILAK
jgi:hypothetical protein